MTDPEMILDEYDLRVLDSIADQSADREARGDPPMMFGYGDDLFEFAAEIGRREAIARVEIRREMDERMGRITTNGG